MQEIRIILGAFLIFLVPGLIWGEVFCLRSSHLLQTIALSLALSLSIETILLPIPFLLEGTINSWLISVGLVSLFGLFLITRRKMFEFIPTLFKDLSISDYFIIGILFLMSFASYRFGENITDIDGEKLIHLTYLRYYFAMPMNLGDLSIIPGMTPPNIIYLWEYLLAGWSTVVGLDPLAIYERSRFVIPILGLSSMYLLIKTLFVSLVKTKLVFFSVLLMCCGGFGLFGTPALNWIKEDSLRGLFSFMGSAHHADTAMEILLPLNLAIGLMAFKEKKYLPLMTGILFATFLWHVREFFQVGIYLAILGIMLLLIRFNLKRWLYLWSPVILVALFFGIFALVTSRAEGVNHEIELKKIALSYAVLPENLVGFRLPFNFPSDLRVTMGLNPERVLLSNQITSIFNSDWHLWPWLILSFLSLQILYFFGNKEDKALGLFYTLSWFILLCWNFTMLLLIVFTYSEINFTTPRMIYLFAYIIIGDALYLVLWNVLKGRKRAFFYSILSCLAFFSMFLGHEYRKNIVSLRIENRNIDWFGPKNPFEMSPDLIIYIKTMPLKQRILVDPIGKGIFSIYSPQYLAVLPQLMGATVIRQDFTQAVFNTDTLDFALIEKWLKNKKVNFIIIQGDHYNKLAFFFQSLKDNYKIVFDNKKEMVVQFNG